MARKQYQAIVDAIDRLARGEAKNSNGKLIPINVAREAGISKATLYRYFDSYEEIRKEFDAAKRQGVRIHDHEITTVQGSLVASEREVRVLRAQNDEYAKTLKLRDQQIFLLWTENKRLTQQLRRSTELGDNVKPFPTPRNPSKNHDK